MSELRQRIKEEVPTPDAGAGASLKKPVDHPTGKEQNSFLKQSLLLVAFVLYFFVGAISIHGTQLLGSPLYFIDREKFYAYMSFTKQCFGLLINSVTRWFAPVPMIITGDADVRAEMKKTKDGRLETNFPERLVLMANHQIYTDWLYLWWISYCNRMHGHIYIILKQSLKYIPVIGPGMIFYGFIFLARNWTKDKPVFQERMAALKRKHAGAQALDPMWLLIFPEGTNLCANGREASKKWAEKSGLEDMRHQLLPRTTGLRFCLQELQGTVDWVYDCTIAYEGVPRGEYGQDIYTLRSMYLEGLYPQSVSMYWRRFAVPSIPIDDEKAFDVWLRERWTEKDDLLEHYSRTGQFPSDDAATVSGEMNGSIKGKAEKDSVIETQVKSASELEFLLLFLPIVAYGLLFYGACKFWTMLRS